MTGVLTLELAALKARETETAAALQRAREAFSASCAQFLRTLTEADRRARVAAEHALTDARRAYDEAHAAHNRAAIVAARGVR